MIGLAYDGFLWLLQQMPGIVLPSGWEGGVNYFVHFGKLLDDVFPAHELFALIVLWFSVKLFVGIYRFVRWLFAMPVAVYP